MPPMPPDFYIPAFSALIAALGVEAAVIKVLWNRNLFVADRNHETAISAIKVTEAVEHSLEANTAAIAGAAAVIGEVRDVVVRSLPSGRAPRASGRSGASRP